MIKTSGKTPESASGELEVKLPTEKKHLLVVKKRVPSNYNVWILWLIDMRDGKERDYEFYGDLTYFGRSEKRTFRKALRRLLERNGLSKDDVRVVDINELSFDEYYKVVKIIGG
ncbi:MAG: hypothetical protein QXZ22_08215 [Sulfolobales archaeon]